MIDFGRNGAPEPDPSAMIYGPMVCLADEFSASDGDLFTYRFKKHKLGKVIGKRTWGGVVGIRGSLPLLDGGFLNKPEFSRYDTEVRRRTGHLRRQRSSQRICRDRPAVEQGDRGYSRRVEDKRERDTAVAALPRQVTSQPEMAARANGQAKVGAAEREFMAHASLTCLPRRLPRRTSAGEMS
ncbi:MAG: S41 family peptidase [Planctomycetota bacterium]